MNQLVTLCLVVLFSLSATAAGTLRFTTNAYNPPFEYYDANNKLVGYDIELAETLCQRLAVTCEFTNNAFERLLPSLQYQHYDAAICALDITRERLQSVDFSDAYRSNSSTFLALRNRFHNLNQLKGKRVGVDNNTTQQAWLINKRPDIITVTYDNYQNSLLDIEQQRIDAIFGDTPAILALLATSAALERVGQPISDPNYFGNGMGIAVRKGNNALRLRLNSALQSMKNDGTLAKLDARWLMSQH